MAQESHGNPGGEDEFSRESRLVQEAVLVLEVVGGGAVGGHRSAVAQRRNHLGRQPSATRTNARHARRKPLLSHS